MTISILDNEDTNAEADDYVYIQVTILAEYCRCRRLLIFAEKADSPLLDVLGSIPPRISRSSAHTSEFGLDDVCVYIRRFVPLI